MIGLILLWAGLCAAAEPPKPDNSLASRIRHMEARLMRPCDKVINLMNDLIRLGGSYQLTQENREALYIEWVKAYYKGVGDFIVVADAQNVAEPGRFMKEFLELKKIAADKGILAEGKMNEGQVAAVHSKNRDRYFYFADPESAEGKNKKDIRYKLEDEYEKLTERWNKARNDFYKQFEAEGEMSQYAKRMEGATKEGREYADQYGKSRSELHAIALSGDFEHCLGEMTAQDYAIQNATGAMYFNVRNNTPDSLPGMGYRIDPQREYKPLSRPAISDFPLSLHLKLNGEDTLRFERDLLKTKIKAEEDETKIIGFGMGKSGQFVFDVLYKTTEALAGPVHMVQYVGQHPIDTFDKSVTFVKNLPQTIGNIDVISLNRQVGEFIANKVENLAGAAVEIAKDVTPITWDRFTPQPGESVQQEIDRLKTQLSATQKVKEGMNVASDITSLVVQALADKGIAKGLGAADDIVRGMRMEVKAAETLKKIDAIQDQVKLAKNAAVLSDEAKQTAKTVKELAEEQMKLNQKLQDMLKGNKPLQKGVAVEGGPLIEAVDGQGNKVFIREGNELGKGGMNTVLKDADDSNLVLRKTNQPMSKEDLAFQEAHDKFGRQVLEKEVKSDAIRVAKMEGEFLVETERGVVRYQKVEKVASDAAGQIKAQGGSMTKGQQLAWEQAQRDLNNAGYVWMDNTPKNFSFDKIPGGDDRWKIVVIDPDGIYPAAGKNPVVAKAMQSAVDKTGKEGLDAMGGVFGLADNFTNEAKKAGLQFDDFNKGIDWDLIKKTDPKMTPPGRELDVDLLHWAPGQNRLHVADDIAKLDDAGLKNTVNDFNSGQISKDPEFKTLMEQHKAGREKLDEALKKIEPEIKQAEQLVDAGPKAAVVPDKPGGLDETPAAGVLLLSQEAAAAIRSEKCALLRKQLLAGSQEKWIQEEVQKCAAEGH
jgi:antirestriction protein